jgi:hypothetical protein
VFLLDITSEEAAFGFRVVATPEGQRVVARIGDLRAVKVRALDGAIEYVVCDAQLQPMYLAAKTLKELRDRFARGEFTG